MARPDDSEPVPRLPRSRGLALDKAAIFRIAMTVALLVMIVVTQRPCADAVSTFVTDFDETGSGAASRQMPKPGAVDVPAADPGTAADYERITPDMTPEQVQQAIERARARAAAERDGTGSGAAGSASAGSASAGSATAGTTTAGSATAGSASAGSATTP